MFSTSSQITAEPSSYDFESAENAGKWKDIFINALQQVQKQVHQSLTARDDALQYVESLILKLLGILCQSQPHSVQDVEERVQKTFPHPIDKWAIKDAKSALEKGGKKKSSLVLPVEKVHPLLKEVLGYKIEHQVSMYIVAVLEYIAADILKLTGNYVKNMKHSEITRLDIQVAMCADKVLMEMFQHDEDIPLNEEEEPVRRGSLTYEEVVKDLILDETQYLRELSMIIKVFRAPFFKKFPRSKDLDVIFSNVLELYNVTVNLISALEETVEMTEENATALVGGCFEDLAEETELDVYEKYVEDILKPHGRERLNVLLQRDDVKELFQESQGYLEAVKYVLPKLLLGPIYHCLHYFDVIRVLSDASPDEEDRESFEQAEGMLSRLKIELEASIGNAIPRQQSSEAGLRYHGQVNRQVARQKMNEIQKSIDGWEGRDIGQACNEFLMEGTLWKVQGRKGTERHLFLFDGMLVSCKPNLKFKEKYYTRKMEIVDREDTDDLKNAFEIQNNVVFYAKTAEDKNNWMAHLMLLQTRSMLERSLDVILQEERSQEPLLMPSQDDYPFTEADSSSNIEFITDERQTRNSDWPLIKGGTLVKLVERLTYHKNADPKLVRTFLTTYRSFCKPQQLLDLLIARFEIPDLEMVSKDDPDELEPGLNISREALNRFRKEYSKPVQFRVVNVMRHWVGQHFYDFENDGELLDKLQTFIEGVKGKAMRKWLESVTKTIQRRLESSSVGREIVHQNTPPQVEWHLTKSPAEFDLMTLHPIEIARQVTLLEADLYRAVRPSELVGSKWTKKEKHITSPNTLAMIRHSTMFTFWLEKCILDAENFEERVAVVSRVLEILMVFMELNNFNGVLEIVSALNSAPIHRLEHTFEEVPNKLVRAFDEAKELNADHFKKYNERLRSINPPCVPFMGMYLTNILHTEEGNPDFLQNNPDLINFSKRRKVAEITGEIQEYQNQPYCLTIENDIRAFFENLNPLGDRTEKEFNDDLYNKSLEIEPRNARQLPKFPRKTEYPLKSPGVKPTSSRHSSSSMLRSARTISTLKLLPHGDECDENSPLLQSNTPPTTPGGHAERSSDSGVFTVVEIRGQDTPNNLSSPKPKTSVSLPLLSALPDDDDDTQEPPPLPPRRGHRESSSLTEQNSPGYNQVRKKPFALPPSIPPRDTGSNPPPIPPRRNSDRESVFATFNGDSEIPELPPKTYRTRSDKDLMG